jgi:hypothetical protein
MARYLLIETPSQIVKNIIEWDEKLPFEVPEGLTIQRSDDYAEIDKTLAEVAPQ